MARKNWTREETIIAFNVYCKVPFRSSSKTHPTIIKYADIIGRSPSALNMKIGNFGRLDPELKRQGISGLINGSKLEEDVWNEFQGNWEELAFKSEELIANFQNQSITKQAYSFPEGKDRLTTIKARVNHGFFRSTILSSYNTKCCITGISTSELLVASHIIPWSADEKNRTNPHNGLCLNSLHDKAYDRGLLTVTPDYEIKISESILDSLSDQWASDFFIRFANRKIFTPERFLPKREFLDFHFQSIFKP